MDSLKEGFFEILNSIDFHSIKDHPNILIAANFWEKDRYDAARICYKFLRAIDDLIDDHKAANKMIDPSEKEDFIENVNSWLKMIVTSDESDPLRGSIKTAIEKFRIPLWPLEDFARSMIYDINNDGFHTLDEFLEYSRGASVAPASIFVHLNGITKNNGIYREPSFDVRETATPCAIFSYLVHIIRDFQKDQLNNLNYFADNLIEKHGLTRSDLKEIAYGRKVSTGFRNLIDEYCLIADNYRKKTYEMLVKVKPLLEPRYQLSLEIIFELYLMVYERINPKEGLFTTPELNPTPDETKARVYKTILNFKPSYLYN